MELLKNYINGELREPAAGTYLDNYEPATGAVYSKVPDSDERDIQQAVEAAKAAFAAWSNTGLEERMMILMRIADGIEKRMDEFVKAESRDNGKTLKLARAVDIPRAVSNFRFYASALQHFASESHQMPGIAVNYTLRQPIGVVGCISPWNLPIYLFSWKIVPALATGNCVCKRSTELGRKLLLVEQRQRQAAEEGIATCGVRQLLGGRSLEQGERCTRIIARAPAATLLAEVHVP